MKLTNIVHRWADIEKLKKGEMIWPSFADLHTSNHCNQFCNGCAYDGMLDKNMMDDLTHFRMVDELMDVGVKAFDFAGGGEPSMLPYLPVQMGMIKDRGGSYAMITNGLILNGSLIDALVSGGTYVRFSLEASCEEDYAKYKKVDPKQWGVVLNNINRLREARNFYHSSLEISVKFAVGASLRGKEHYQRCIDLGRKLGAERITIKSLRHAPEELPKTHSQHEDALLREVIADEHAENIVSHWIVPYEDFQVSQCWLNPVHTVIDWNGDVYICCYFYYGRQDELKIGNIKERPFKDIWTDQLHKDVIKGIDRYNCMEVDCKFFKHHEAVHWGLSRKHMEFL